ncbi:MAG TPA: imidazolonepropionase [Anaeromyxobacter sp.]|nr:imidazolonepropionase [Anaeromyxobacter sp.]
MWDLLLRHARLVPLVPGGPASVEDGALAVKDGAISWAGPERELPARSAAAEERDASGALLTPGLIDCHTHLVYAGQRAAEHELRLAGASYEDVAKAGGGIRSTVAATRNASEQALREASRPRLLALLRDGVTTVEVKSGYGLERETELRQLRVARRLGEELCVTVRTTFLGAHAVPAEWSGRADGYVDQLIAEVLPAAAAAGLVDAVDAYCEPIAFSPAQVDRLFAAARRMGLPVKLHADQRSDQGGAALVARHRGLSADHLEHASAAGVAELAATGTVAVLLPGAYFFLREPRKPPVEALRAAGVPLALATDLNPGTSPLGSLLAAMAMGCTLFGLTVAEALAATTRNAARALGLSDRGMLAAGLRADLALWRAEHPAELATCIGISPLAARWVAGRLAHDPPT